MPTAEPADLNVDRQINSDLNSLSDVQPKAVLTDANASQFGQLCIHRIFMDYILMYLFKYLCCSNTI